MSTGEAEQPRTGGVHERWIVFVSAHDRSGTLTALAETFSSRGVSFTSFTTLTVADGAGAMSIIFRASERLARVLARTLERLAMTRTVSLHRASEPAVRAVAVVAVVAGAVGVGGSSVAVTRAGWADGGAVIVSGSLVDVEAALEPLPVGAVHAITVLPPA
ncbi:hypothetical protein AB0N73_03750 [Microbacterium sp. NPDC089189]|uniref:hypothetical protein n=1 Tax=Microbacterium sp. NPDC089189 TaxID=3154972 RepID=UPI003431DBC4